MKLLSLALPGLSGLDRVWGKIGFRVGGELMDEAGGEGSVGWRKPPGPGTSEAEVMEEDSEVCGQDGLWWGSLLTDREGEARRSSESLDFRILSPCQHNEEFQNV